MAPASLGLLVELADAPPQQRNPDAASDERAAARHNRGDPGALRRERDGAAVIGYGWRRRHFGGGAMGEKTAT